jgi:hypothetical protein
MEVHHSHHVGHTKKWKEYLLEFLMLFLAVSLGFLAENYRESYIEMEREHELAKSLYEEMRADSIDLEKAIAFRAKKEYYLNYLYENYTGDSDNDSIQKLNQVAQIIGLTTTSQTIFEPRNAIIQQLMSSGMMRYFKDEKIQSDLHDIINNADKIKIRLQGESDIYLKFVLPVILKYRNMDMVRKFSGSSDSNKSMLAELNDYLNSKEYYKFPKVTIPENDLKELRKTFEYYRFLISSTRRGNYMIYKKSNANLLRDLRAHYHF